MLGLNLLFRLGRWLLVEPVEESGLMPEGYYRSRALAALEEDDFPESLRYLKLAGPPDREAVRLLGQLIILRLRLLKEQHQRRCQAVEELQQQTPPAAYSGRYQELLDQEYQALDLLGRYEQEAMAYLG
ncbi:MAG: hypothetical protein JRI57_03875 [Deltaproteobacteria bacterium]|nr:hypothetical protein [Deltaproteobacteria bacterium]MBW1951709.1 hypothetical protein [Deltaproteobacteria bacterium]MBW1987580.1 hypothetical protein [Deltaproteobacteria bacterium]